MELRAQHHFPHSLQQLAKRRIIAKVRAQHQRVHEESDQPFSLEPVAARDRRSDHDVLLARVPGEQHIEHRKQGHEERHPFAPAQLFQPFSRRGAEF